MTILSWIGLDQKKLKFWVENSRLFKIENKNEIVWLDLLIELLNISSIKEEILAQVMDSNIFEIRSWSGSLSEEMRRRLPSITALKAKLETSHPELLALVSLKETEWLKRIEVQSKEDEQESKQNSERFDW